MQNGSSPINHHGSDSFVYYLPQADGSYSPPQNETMQDIVNTQRHFTDTSRVATSKGEKTGAISRQDEKSVKEASSKPVVVDLTLDDSDDEELSTSQTENTFPKIIAAYSLTENTPFADLSNLLNHKVKDNQIKENNIVVDSLVLKAAKTNGPIMESQPFNLTRPVEAGKQSTSNGPTPLSLAKPAASQKNAVRAKPNGLVFDNRTKSLDSKSHDPRTYFPTCSNNVIKDLTNQVPARSTRNDVIHDVTNTRNYQSFEYRPMLFSSRQAVTTSSNSDDNVVITKVVSPTTDNTNDRRKHRRKAPIEVRQWCFEEQNSQVIDPTSNNDNQSNTIRDSLNALEDNATKKTQRNSPNNIHREAKIRTLKNLLAKQEKAVEKIRTIDSKNSPLVSTDRMLVVEIPDLKSELRIPSPGKHSFRVSSQTITISPKGDDDSPRKRPRKRDPRKISRQEHRYPSYVEASDDEDFVASKRLKGKPKSGRKSRGRNSPKLINQIPVVSKDLWHRELQKVEEKLALSGEPMNQSSFLMFLGLRKT